MLVWVTKMEYLGGYRLRLEFNDGLAGEVDLESRLFGEVFAPLRDPAYFAQVRLDRELDTVTWPNGADFAPEFLHAAVRGEASAVAEP
ncbi:MAG TPA: DUF2442 domain-containing protein [Thermoanaerobaculia bacterium]|nr:DUF2442 domain-containing protein [Thermoanaerobaculia bacterium]